MGIKLNELSPIKFPNDPFIYLFIYLLSNRRQRLSMTSYGNVNWQEKHKHNHAEFRMEKRCFFFITFDFGEKFKSHKIETCHIDKKHPYICI